MEKYSGGCRCKKITFKISGEPTWKVNCNCNWCQTTSGSAFRSFVLFKENDISFLGEKPKSYEDKTTDHGRPMVNHFCDTCGTIVGIKVPSMEAQHISIGIIDQRKKINITCNIWGEEALKFTAYSKDADVYKKGYWNGTGKKMLIDK
tara:strand:+ start:1293 stop:1736 length:444 start_codon:yes stop_codon:yes gene_type:complete